MAKTILHKAESRNDANDDWLQIKDTFSFALYHNPERMHFGMLQILNDDWVDGGVGFGAHDHNNMEIISIPLEGDLEHKDSNGNTAINNAGDEQVISADTEGEHTGHDKDLDKPRQLLQIWVLPDKKEVQPGYDQLSLNPADRHNKLQLIISPKRSEGGVVWINQNAWCNLANFDKGIKTTYQIHTKENGVYVFVLNGDITVNNQPLNTRDGFGLWDIEEVFISADRDAEFLLTEVPMN
ncbi:MAG: pirin family protein [Gelidibacter sp.]